MISRKLTLSELGRMSVEDHKRSKKLPVVLILDNLRSQHNIGSLFRTADAFRLEGISLCGITATPPNREIQKTALGATESVEWNYFQTTQQAIRQLREKKYFIIAVEQTEGSISLESFFLPENQGIGLIFGNEVSGVAQEIINMVDACVEVPQYGTKHSLNVAVTAGIVSWELFNKMNAINPKFLHE